MMTSWVALLVLMAPALALQKPPDTPPAAQQPLPRAPSPHKCPQPHKTALHTDWDEVTATSAFVRGIGYVVWYPVAMEAVSISEPDYERSVGEWKQRHAGSTMKLTVGTPANLLFTSNVGILGSDTLRLATTSRLEFYPFWYLFTILASA